MNRFLQTIAINIAMMCAAFALPSGAQAEDTIRLGLRSVPTDVLY